MLVDYPQPKPPQPVVPSGVTVVLTFPTASYVTVDEIADSVAVLGSVTFESSPAIAPVLSMLSTSFCAVPAFIRVEPEMTSGPSLDATGSC